MDAFNYECTGNGLLPPDDLCGWQDTYRSLADSALYFAVQIPQDIDDSPPADDPKDKLGDLRRRLPDEDGTQATQDRRKELLDTDGTLPKWLAETLCQVLIEVYATEAEGGNPELQKPGRMVKTTIDPSQPGEALWKDVPHPQNLQGQTWQDELNGSTALLSYWLEKLEVQNLPTELKKLREIIAPDSKEPENGGFKTPPGFPFPWEIQAAYRFMLSWFKRSFMSSGLFNMPCPEPPKVFTPPAEDVPFSEPPDFGGVNPDDDPISQVCGLIAAVLDWVVKQIDKAGKFLYDLAKMALSGATWPLREELYEKVTLPIWEACESIRMVLCHLGYFMPQSAQNWPGTDNMKYPNEIDDMLIRLGHSVNSAFEQALAAAADPLGNLDTDPSLNTDGVRDTLREPFPWLPVRSAPGTKPPLINLDDDDMVEFLRPWAYPDKNNESDPARNGNFLEGPLTVAGPYVPNTMPHEIIEAQRPISNIARVLYEQAGCPHDTQLYSETFIQHKRGTGVNSGGYEGHNPLGDPVPFSAYLIGQLACNSKFTESNFNLDADRGYGYLCWDWERADVASGALKDGRDHVFPDPSVLPEGSYSSKWGKKWTKDEAKKWNANPQDQIEMNMHKEDVKVKYFGRKACVEPKPQQPPPPPPPTHDGPTIPR
jgi:hypothetical protein